MKHKNYTQYSQNKNNKEVNNNVIDGQITVFETVNPEEGATLSADEVINNLTTEDVATVNDDGNLTGVVTGCTRLYVRERPDKHAKPLCLIDVDEEVTILTDEATTEDFYSVITSSGVKGYCMKNYITVN